MVASLILENTPADGLGDLLSPAPSDDGLEPEGRIIFCGLDWRRYLSVDERLGEDRSSPRLFYLDGALEIMTASFEHERLKKWIGGFVELYADDREIEIITQGQATMRDALASAGAEPDDAWCFRTKKEVPDLLLEIALTSGGLDKLEIYRRFGVPEVWIWRAGKLEFHLQREDGAGYALAPRSGVFPSLEPALIERCVSLSSRMEARRVFRTALEGR